MTALSVLLDASSEVGIDLPEENATSTEVSVRQIVAHVNFTGQELVRRAEWTKLTRRVDVAEGDSYVLPNDYHRLAERGAVNLITTDNTYVPIRVVVSPEQWAFLQSRASLQHYCHLEDGELKFIPRIPFSGARVTYISDQWVEGGTRITGNGDVFDVPEALLVKGAVWRWKRQKGQSYSDDLSEYEAMLLAEIKADRGTV